MEKRNDGGPAFPVEGYWKNGRITQGAQTGNETGWHMGLSLRDYFAAKAMQAIIAKSPFLAEPDDFTPYEKTAIGAYDYADAMLKARGE